MRRRGRAIWSSLILCALLTGCAEATPEAVSEAASPAAAVEASPTPAPAPGAAAQPRTLVARIHELRVADAVRAGYDRELFDHWIDADGDCQDTRQEVLAAESETPVSGCRIDAGRWRSYYDDRVWIASGEVDIDHMVPLAEAWDSGARHWSADTRRRFANDLDDERSLVAVTDDVNRAKSDRDPAGWLPDQQVCRYLGEWVAVKTRWSLAVDPPERDALLDAAGDCPDQPIDVQPAAVATEPPPTPEPGIAADRCVDINRDGVAELQRIVHIGAERAPHVVTHRPYDSLAQLQRIDGIGASRIRDIHGQELAATDC